MTPSWLPAIIVNSFAILVLLILLVDFGEKQHRFRLQDQRIFQCMLITNIVILALDTCAWLLNGSTFAHARTLNLLVTAAYYAVDPIMSLLYVAYCEIKIGTPFQERKRLFTLYCIPVALNFVLSLISIRYPLMFDIQENNVYTRAPMLYLSFIFSYSLLAVSFIRVFSYYRRVIKDRKQRPFMKRRQGLVSLLIFPMIPLIGGALQVWYCPVTVVWLTTVFALLILYLNIQNTEISTDALTGLFNRRKTDSYLQSLLQASRKNAPICLAMIDMDNFKQINDSFGHLTGDHALRVMASTLHAECDADTFFSRYGGDEFVIISRNQSEAWLEALLERITANLNQYCQSCGVRYTLAISFGIATWTDDMESVDALFAVADEKLYQDKAKMNRRKDDK